MPSITIAGREVLFDEKDASLVLGARWTIRVSGSTAYVQRVLHEGGKYCGYESLHRLISDCPEGMVVDHINGNGLDNRRLNLRLCSAAENSRNRRAHSNNACGVKGVYLDASRGRERWRAQISVCGRKIRLGSFSDMEQAAAAYAEAAKRLHGEFSRIA